MAVADANTPMHEHCHYPMSSIGAMVDCTGGLLLSDVSN